MNGREALEALLQYCEEQAKRYGFEGRDYHISLADLRAALASKDAGPQEKSAADCGHTEAWRSVCDELSIGNPLWLRGTGSAITLAKAELSRLRAIEKAAKTLQEVRRGSAFDSPVMWEAVNGLCGTLELGKKP